MYDWHKMDDLPCPGAFVMCEGNTFHHTLFYGYVMVKEGEKVLLELPSAIKPPRTTIEPHYLLFSPLHFRRWSYMERNLCPTQVLTSYEQRYETEYQ